MRCAKIENDVVVDCIEAPSVEWCLQHLEGDWREVDETIGVGHDFNSIKKETVALLNGEHPLYSQVDRAERRFYFAGSRLINPQYILSDACINETPQYTFVPFSELEPPKAAQSSIRRLVEESKRTAEGDKWAFVKYVQVLDEMPGVCGVILTIFKSPLDDAADFQPVPGGAPTLAELLRLILEWDWAYGLGNRQPIAVAANAYVKNRLSAAIKTTLTSTVHPMQIGRFLIGDPDANKINDLGDVKVPIDDFRVLADRLELKTLRPTLLSLSN